MQSANCYDIIQYIVNTNQKGALRMKEGLHPEYKEVTVRCACGEEFVTRSTKDNIRVEICSKCHPFFTGKQKFVDSGGRVDKFKKRLEAAKH